MMFHIVEDAQIGGVFYQKKLYRRGTRLYAGWAGDATSNPNVSWEEIDVPFPKDANGNPIFEEL